MDLVNFAMPRGPVDPFYAALFSTTSTITLWISLMSVADVLVLPPRRQPLKTPDTHIAEPTFFPITAFQFGYST